MRTYFMSPVISRAFANPQGVRDWNEGRCAICFAAGSQTVKFHPYTPPYQLPLHSPPRVPSSPILVGTIPLFCSVHWIQLSIYLNIQSRYFASPVKANAFNAKTVALKFSGWSPATSVYGSKCSTIIS